MSRVIRFEELSRPESDKLHLNFGARKRASGTLTVHKFQDNGHFVAYMPSLNLSAYGESEKEACDRLVKEVLDDFFGSLWELSPEQANGELEKLGWTRSKLFKKRFTSNSYIDRHGVLKNFNLPEETKVDTAVVTV